MNRLTFNNIIKITPLFVLALVVVQGVVPQSASAKQTIHHQYMGDVTGDLKSDAITLDIRTGDWWIAPSTGGEFTSPSRWISGFGVGTYQQFIEDVNGDNMSDAVTYDVTTGDWWVALSTGSVFNTPSRWINGHGVGSSNQVMGDINGDGKSDAIVFFDRGAGWSSGKGWGSGAWWGATSDGMKFEAPGLWFSGGHGVGSTNQFAADVTGDGAADAVVYSSTTGQWWVSDSNGVRFSGGPNKWIDNWGVSTSPTPIPQFMSYNQAVIDVDGDGKADAIISDSPQSNNNFAAFSVGYAFSGSRRLSHQGYASSNIFFTDVDGDGKSDEVGFDKNVGSWGVSGSTWLTGFGVGTN